MIQKLKDLNIQFEELGISVLESQNLLKDWVKNNIHISIQHLAEEHAHKILFTLPYYSDLRPIELLWAFIKGNVGRKYSKGATFGDVLSRLQEEFKILHTPDGSSLIQSIIESIDKKIARFQEESKKENEARFFMDETGSAAVDEVILESDSESCELESNSTIDLTGLDS